MQGFLVGFFKLTKNEPKQFEHLVVVADPYFIHLRCPSSQKRYKGSIKSVVTRALKHQRLFLVDGKGCWMMDTLRVRHTEKLFFGFDEGGFQECKVPSREQIKAHYHYTEGQDLSRTQQAFRLLAAGDDQDQLKKEFELDLVLKMERKRLVEKLENLFLKTYPLLEFVWENFKGDQEDFKRVWNSLDDQVMVGMLHAFVLLKPILQPALASAAKAEKAAL